MACPEGFEPPTYGLEGRCYYPTELRAGIIIYKTKTFELSIILLLLQEYLFQI